MTGSSNNINRKIRELLYNNTYTKFIDSHLHLSGSDIMLRFSAVLGSDAAFVAGQVDCFRKAKTKLPLFFERHCYYTPRSLEQATAEPVAFYKKKLIRGDTLLELCGGLGVDAWALSGNFNQVTSVDSDEVLNTIAEYNYTQLGIHNVKRVTDTAEAFIAHASQPYSVIYADPDRRPEAKRTGSLKGSLPDITGLLPALLELAKDVYIKTSPMYDISMGLKELRQVSHVYVIAYRNEVKELLFHISCLPVVTSTIIAVNIHSDNRADEMVFVGDESPGVMITETGDYLFEPNVAIIKSGRYRQYAAMLSLGMMDRNIPFFLGMDPVQGFCGRQFHVVAAMPYNPKQLKQYFKSLGIEQANISIRGADMKPEQVYNISGLKEGGDVYLFVTRNTSGKIVVFDCRKI